MKLFKISTLIILFILIESIFTKPSDENDPDSVECTEDKLNDNELNTEPADSVSEEDETKENECTESDEKQSTNECNEIESNGNGKADDGDNDENNENGSCKELEATKEASDSPENLKDKVKDAIDGINEFIKSILKCQLNMPEFRQCIMSESAIGFSKSEAGETPMPTAPPDMGNSTGFTGYHLKDWVKFVLSKEVETPSVSFAPVSMPDDDE